MINKDIFTIWFGDEVPLIIKKCIESQKIPGYTHRVLSLDDIPKDIPYVEECLRTLYYKEQWCKLSDYLRIHTLVHEGGIYLDSDVYVLKNKNFDALLSDKGFAGYFDQGQLGTSVLGGEANHPFFEAWLQKLNSDHHGNMNDILDTSIYLINHLPLEGMHIYPKDVFYPYRAGDPKHDFTNQTIAMHYFMGTWV